MPLLNELKRRNVLRVGTAYVVVAWLIIQVVETIFPLYGFSNGAIRLVITVLAIGLLPVVILAWAFELTPEGLKRDKDVDRSQSISLQTGKKLDRMIMVVLALALGYFAFDKFVLDPKREAAMRQQTAEQLASATENARKDGRTEALIEYYGEKSIAVLPFANRSRSEDDAFFSDGIHDDLLTQLAKFRDLKVISRTSVMKYKGTEKTIPEIAKELGVSTILEGGIQRAGKRIRINAQLIDVTTDQHLWAETFDREMTVANIFEIQSEITQHIVKAVRGEMTEEEELNLSWVPTNNMQAYEAYLQALSLINRADYSQENFIEAETWANKSVELDQEFAQVWALLVGIHAQATWIGYDISPERFANAKTALDNSIKYGPDVPETIAAQAEYEYRIENDYKKSVETFKKALIALPGDIGIMHSLGAAQRRAGFLEDSIATFEKSLELDPNYSRSSTTMIETLIYMKEFDRASSLIDNFILKYPDARDLRIYKVQILMFQGELESARILVDSMPQWASIAYYITATLLPMLERDYEETIAVQNIPEVAVVAKTHLFIGKGDMNKAWAYRFLGDEQSALNQANLVVKKLTSSPRPNANTFGFMLSTLAEAYAFIGENDLAIAAARESLVLLPEDSDSILGTDNSEIVIRTLAMVGKRDEALVEIERLLQHPTGYSPWILYLDPRWDFFRDDERFNALAKPAGLEVSRK